MVVEGSVRQMGHVSVIIFTWELIAQPSKIVQIISPFHVQL